MPQIIKSSKFEAHIPPWSATISYNAIHYVNVTNTCTIDYFLFALWTLKKTVPEFTDNLPKKEPSN